MWAGWPDSLWWECHSPGGVTNAEWGFQSTLIPSLMLPSRSRVCPTIV